MDARTERWNLLWAAQRSQRYHARRMAFFDRWHKMTAIVGIMGGSAVFASHGGALAAWLPPLAAALVVLMSTIDLVVGTAVMARCHNDLRRRFCLLESAIQSKPEATAADLRRWKEERLSIEGDEPPKYAALDILCENELLRATSHTKAQPPYALPWYKGVSAQWLRWADA